jgi:hypothetical protein
LDSERSLVLRAAAKAVFDVVVDNEIQLFFRESVVLGEDCVDFVDDGFGFAKEKFLIRNSKEMKVVLTYQQITLHQRGHF